jgi:hypothetical protein
VPLEAATFTELAYEPHEDGFGLRLAYEGQTRVDGEWQSPWVTIQPGATDPYDALARHSALIRADGLAPAATPSESPAKSPPWWREPIFCGWGAQCHLGGWESRVKDLATQEHYDGFLAALAAEGVLPGTIVIDDKWQRAYGLGEPDAAKWPDLRGWIADRHAAGQRVLLWWKAWDPEGLPADLCITNPAGIPVTTDPTNPGYEAALRASIRSMLSPAGLDADGFKVDFTAQGPSGPDLRRAGREWGIALLHRLLAIVYDEAKRTKPDALVVTHTPNPAFGDVTDMVRLNDLLRLEDLAAAATVRAVPQMRHRAAIVRSALPDHLIDTDDWCMSSRSEWRAYLATKTSLGVPALYYATGIDFTGEPFRPEDYAALRATWAAWRASLRSG